MRKIILMIIALSFQFLTADDVYMKTGQIMRNVKFLEKVMGDKEMFYHVQSTERMRRIPESNLLFIDSTIAFDSSIRTYTEQMPDSIAAKYGIVLEKTPVSPGMPRVIISKEDSIRRVEIVSRIMQPKKEYPHIAMLSVSALSFIYAADCFLRAADIQEGIDNNNKYNDYMSKLGVKFEISNDKAESAKSRAVVLGIAGLLSGVFTTAYALKSVEVKTDGKSISMQYNF